jgi:hypothetical protein
MPDEEFEEFVESLFREIVLSNPFILGVNDTTPPDTKFERLLRITEIVREWERKASS